MCRNLTYRTVEDFVETYPEMDMFRQFKHLIQTRGMDDARLAVWFARDDMLIDTVHIKVISGVYNPNDYRTEGDYHELLCNIHIRAIVNTDQVYPNVVQLAKELPYITAISNDIETLMSELFSL